MGFPACRRRTPLALGEAEKPCRTAPAGWLDDNLNGESGRSVLEQLSAFVRSEETPPVMPVKAECAHHLVEAESASDHTGSEP